MTSFFPCNIDAFISPLVGFDSMSIGWSAFFFRFLHLTEVENDAAGCSSTLHTNAAKRGENTAIPTGPVAFHGQKRAEREPLVWSSLALDGKKKKSHDGAVLFNLA